MVIWVKPVEFEIFSMLIGDFARYWLNWNYTPQSKTEAKSQ